MFTTLCDKVWYNNGCPLTIYLLWLKQPVLRGHSIIPLDKLSSLEE